MSSFLDSTGLSHLIEKIKSAFISKADTTTATTISIDSTPTANSTNLVTSGGVKTALDAKANTSSLATVATSGSYNDLTDKPNIPTNTNTLAYKIRYNATTRTVTDTARYYKLYFSSANGTQWVPASVNSSNDTTTARTPNQRPIDPFGPIVYTSANTNYTSGSNLAAATAWLQLELNLGYSFGPLGTGLTTKTPVYLKCAPQSGDSAIIDSTAPIVQALPNTEDGKIYIYLGISAASGNSSLELNINHPVYYYKNGAIRLWTGSSADEDISRIESVTETALSDLEKKHQRNVKRIEDLEDGYEAIYDDIERIESTTPKIELDEVPTSGSNNAVSSGGVYTALSNKQSKLTAGDNIIIEEIPENYSRLEYIQTSGTQYIDTGITGHMNYTYEIDFQQTTAGYFRTWGVLGQNNYVGLNMSLTYASGFAVRWESRSGESALISLGNVTDTDRHKVKIQNGYVYYDGSNKGVSAGHDEDTIINYNTFLGTINPAGGSVESNTSAKFYSYKVWNEAGELIQNLIPIKDASQVVGMYDLVTGATLYNSGTGNFTSGSDTNENTVIKVNPDIISKSTASIPYGIVDSTSTSTLFTVTVPGITADNLEDGTCILVTNNKVTSAAASADPKCWKLNVNGLGALPVFTTQAIATYATIHFGVNYTFMFVYNSSFTATAYSGPGWRICQLFNTNSDTIGYQLRTNSSVRTVTDTARYYKLYFTSADDTQWVPASVNSTNNYTGARTPNQRPIDPFGPIVYTTASTNYTANSNLAATTIWRQYTFNLGYSFGPLGTGLTTNTPVYIKCAPQSGGSAIIDETTPVVQALPSTDDGKIYIYLGIAYSAINVELDVNHPIYYYKDGSIRIWTNASIGGVSVTELDSENYPLTSGIIVSHYVSSGYLNINSGVEFKTTDPILYYDSTCSLAFKERKNVVFSSGTGNGETWFIKCSPNNDEEYYKYYSFGGWVKGADLPQTADGFIYIPIGNSNSSGHLDFVSSEKTYMYFEGKFQEVSNIPILSYRESTGNAIELYEGEIVDCGTISNPEFDLIVGGNDIGEYRVFFTCGLSGMSLTFNDVIVNWKEIPQMILDNVYEINILRVDNKFYGIIIMYE